MPGGDCVLLSQQLCSFGTYQGDGTVCDPNPCPAGGACCFPQGSCLLTTATSCANQGGTYQGNSTQCEASTCPQPTRGACCFTSGACGVLTGAIALGPGLPPAATDRCAIRIPAANRATRERAVARQELARSQPRPHVQQRMVSTSATALTAAHLRVSSTPTISACGISTFKTDLWCGLRDLFSFTGGHDLRDG